MRCGICVKIFSNSVQFLDRQKIDLVPTVDLIYWETAGSYICESPAKQFIS